jgi:glyoxylate carboligase
MAPVNGGQLMARFLEDAGVRHIFSISGGSINPLYSAAEGTNIQIIHTRHDGAAAFMAEGYGRLTRGPGICALTLGTAGRIQSSLGPAPLLLRGSAFDHEADYQVCAHRPRYCPDT